MFWTLISVVERLATLMDPRQPACILGVVASAAVLVVPFALYTWLS
jgi:hypothetical protein